MNNDPNPLSLNHTPDYTIDARNQPCPMPILMLKRLLKSIDKDHSENALMNVKTLILIKATDPISQQDLAYFCQIQQLKIIHQTTLHKEYHYYIER